VCVASRTRKKLLTLGSSRDDVTHPDETECERQCVSVRAIVVESDSCWASNRVIVELRTAKPVESASLSWDVISLRRRIKSFLIIVLSIWGVENLSYLTNYLQFHQDRNILYYFFSLSSHENISKIILQKIFFLYW
jgi:hypothetical protein